MSGGGVQGEFIPVCTETKQAAACDVTEIAFMPKILSGKSVAQMHFDERDLNCQQGVAQRDTRVRESTWVQNDKFDVVGGGSLDAVDQLVLGIALIASEFVPQLRSEFSAVLLNVGECSGAVNLRFAGPQKVQIRTIDKQ